MFRQTTKSLSQPRSRSILSWLVLAVVLTACQKKKSEEDASDLTGDDGNVRSVIASGAKQPISGSPTVTIITGIDGAGTVTLGGDVTAPAPGSAGAITSSNATYTSLSLSWAAAADDRAAPNELVYQVYRSTSANIVTVADCERNGEKLLSAPEVGKSALDLTALVAETDYYFNVVAKDPAGNAAAYAMLKTGTKRDTIAPTAGGAAGSTANTTISATLTPTTAALAWTKATDDLWPAASLTYTVFYSTSAPLTTVSDMETNGTSAGVAVDAAANLLSGLAPSGTYYVNVRVTDSSGNKSAYAPLTIQMPSIPISAVKSTVSIAGDATTVASGVGIAVTVQAKDSTGANVVTGGAIVAVTISGGTSTYSASSPIAAVDNGNGTYTATLTGVLAGTAATVGATINGTATTSTKTLSVTPGAIAASTSVVSIVGAVSTVASGTNVSVKLQAKDAAGNTVTSGGASVTFTKSGGTSTFIQSFPVTATNVGDGTYTASLTGNVPGTDATIGATVGGVATTSTATLRVVPGAIAASMSTVSIVGGATSITSSSSAVIRLQAKDAFGNNLTTGGATVKFTRSGGVATFTQAFPVTAIDNNDGTYSATLTGNQAGSAPTLSATINTAAVSSTTSLSVTPGAISTATSVVSIDSGATTVSSGSTVTVKLQAKDAAGNNLLTGPGGTTVKFTQTGGVSTFSEIFPLTAVDNGNGTYSATLTGYTAGTAKTLGATINTTAVTSTTSMTVLPGTATAANSVLSIVSGATTVASGSNVTLQLQAKDAAGNSLTASAGLAITFTLGAGASTFTQGFPITPTNNNNGTYTATLTGNQVGSARTFGATVGGTVTTSTTNMRVIPGPISMSNSVLSIVGGASSVASGGTATLKLQAKDAANNLLDAGGPVVIFTSAGGVATFNELFPITATDNTDGTYTATLTGNQAGSAPTLAAKIGSTVFTSTTGLSVTPGTISTATSVVSIDAGATSVSSGSTVTVRMQAKDAAGNNLLTGPGGTTVKFTQTGGLSTFSEIFPLTAVDNGDGTYSATLTGYTSGTAKTLGATINTAPVTSTTNLIVNPGTATAANSVVSIVSGATTVASGSSVTLQLQAKDAAGNSLTASSGLPVSFTLGAGGSTFTQGFPITPTNNNNGTYTATITGNLIGSARTFGATVNSTVTTSTTSLTVTPGSISTATSVLSIVGGAVSIASGSSATLKLQAKDAAGNDLAAGGATVSFTETGGVSTFTQTLPLTPTYIGGGAYTATLTGYTSGSAKTLGATIGGSAITSTTSLAVTPGPISAAQSQVTAASSSVAAGSNVQIKVTAYDAANNRITIGGETINFTRTGGTCTFTQTFALAAVNNGDGTYTANLTGSTAGSAATIGATFGATTITSTTSVDVNANVGASITGEPVGTNNTTVLAVTVAGTSVTQFKYKVGLTASTTCSDSTSYIGPTALGTAPHITDNISGTGDGPMTLCVVGGDASSNWQTYAAATVATWTKKATRPTATLATSAPNKFNTSSISFTLTYSDPVSVVALSDISVGNGTPSNLTGSGANYAFTVTPTAEGNVTIDVPQNGAVDVAGNNNTAATGFVRIYDITAPTIALTSSGYPATKVSPIPVTVTFSEDVLASFTSSDVSVVNGSISNFLGSGASYSFNVTPTGQGTVTVDVGANAALDAASNNNTAAPTLSLTYDTVAPGVTITSNSTTSTTNVSPIPVAVAFTESVGATFTSGDVTVGNGTISAFAGSGANYTFNVTPSGQGAVTVAIAAGVASDDATNGNTVATTLTRTYDTTAPTVALTSVGSGPTNSSTIAMTATFTKSVTGFVDTDITVGNGTVSGFSGSGTTYTFNVTPSAQGVVTIDVGSAVAVDTAGNGNTAATQHSRTYDSLAPTVVIDSTAGPQTKTSPIPITVLFSESVGTSFTSGDVTIGNGTIINFSGSGASYSFGVTPTGQGSVTVDIAAGRATDDAGNGNTIASQIARTYDSLAPGVTITSNSTTSTTNVSPIPVAVAFTESVGTTFTSGDVTVGNGTISAFAGSGANYTFDVTPSGQGAVTVAIAAGVASDDATNGNTVATTLTRTYDSTAPTVTLSSATAQAPLFTNTSPIPVSVTISESVTTFTSGDVTVGNGTVSGFSGSGTSYSFNVTPSGQGSVTVNVNAGTAPDAAANNNTAATQLTFTYDSVAPVVSSVTATNASGTYGLGQVISIQVVFDSAVTVTGTPTLTLNTTPTARTATYASGSGTSTLVFSYTTQAGDGTASNLDYATTSALALAGGTIRDSASNNATLTLPTVGGTSSLAAKLIVINTTSASVQSVDATTANGSYTTGSVIAIRVVFNDIMTVTGTPTLALNTSPARSATFDVASNNTTDLIFNYTVQAGDIAGDLGYSSVTALALAGGTISDSTPNAAVLTLPADGSGLSLADSKDIIIDTTVPTVTGVSSNTTNGSYTVDVQLDVTVSFAEPVFVTGAPRIQLNVTNNTATTRYATYVSGSGTGALVFSYTVQGPNTSLGDQAKSPELDYASTTALGLNAGTIKDAAGNNATLTLAAPGAAGSLGANKNLIIDSGLPPSLTISGVTCCSVNSLKANAIELKLNYPTDTSAFNNVKIRRAAGSTPPSATDCTSHTAVGSPITVFTPNPSTLTADDVGAYNGGGVYSYRACAFDASNNVIATSTVSALTASNFQWAIVRSTTSNGNLTNVATATANCTGTSSAGWAVDNSLEWTALLSDTAMEAAGRVPITGSVYNRNPAPAVVATSYTTMWGGSATAITYDETGAASSGNAWTGSTAAGGRDANRCTDWSVTTGNGMAGAVTTSTMTGTTTSGSVTVSALSSTSSLSVGSSVSGAGIPAGTKIATIPSSTTITLTVAATASATGVSLTFAPMFSGASTTCTSALRTYCVSKNIEPLTAFSVAKPGSGAQGDVAVTVDFPATTTNWTKLEIRRKLGPTPPVSACNTDTLVKTYNGPTFTDETFTDATARPGAYYSYIACLYKGTSVVATVTSAAPVRTYHATTANTIFVTNTATYTGLQSGFTNIDAACTTAGNKIDSSKTWLGLVSMAATAASSRPTSWGNIRNINGDLVASSQADLFDGTLTSAVTYTELGTLAGAAQVWTGSDTNGAMVSGGLATANTCTDWTTNAGGSKKANIGIANSATGTWLNNGTLACSKGKRFYCISSTPD